MKKGIIFDLDGTLWDSSENVALAYSEVMQRHGFGTLSRDGLKKLMGKTMDAIAEALFPSAGEEEREKLMDEAMENEQAVLRVKGGVLYPQLEETLAELGNRYPLYIVSNCQCGYIETFYEAHGLEKYFSGNACFGEAKLQKAENIKLLMQRRALDRAVYVGDTMGDYEASCGAGIPFIHARYGFGEVPQAQYAINSISELPALADKILSD